MIVKWIGALFIILGCGGFGVMLTINHRREVTTLNQLIVALDNMDHQLLYQHTPLPDLCRYVCQFSSGVIRDYFQKLAERLEEQNAPNVNQCATEVLKTMPCMPASAALVLNELGCTLGALDLRGQVSAIESATVSCKDLLNGLTKNQEERLRNYQTLGLCAGAALAILLV